MFEMCKMFANLSVFANLSIVWDGTFSYVSITDPTEDDIKEYHPYVKVAVYSHVCIGCNITPKVYLMWKHVEKQLSVISRGLGQ